MAKEEMILIEFAFKKLSFDLSPHFLKRGIKYITPRIFRFLIQIKVSFRKEQGAKVSSVLSAERRDARFAAKRMSELLHPVLS